MYARGRAKPGRQTRTQLLTAKEHPLVLYSTNTKLAVEFNSKYYKGMHYVFCSPYYNPWAHGIDNAGSSNPCELYHSFATAVLTGDENSAHINQNKLGLRKGIIAKYKAHVITKAVRAKLISMVDASKPRDYTPVLFVIPYSRVAGLAKEVSLNGRNTLSREYVIESLPSRLFDAVQLERTTPSAH